MRNLFTLVLSVTLIQSFASVALWKNVSGRNLQISGTRKIIPQKAALMQLDDAAFRQLQSSIPAEESGKSLIIALPTPAGELKNFYVFERTSMEPELAAKYPMIKTYEAISMEDPSVTAKLDYTAFGFHAMVFNHGNTFFIDPYSDVNTGFYTCYFKKDYTRSSAQFEVCGTKSSASQNNTNTGNLVNPSSSTLPVNRPALAPDGKRRTFRLALACTIEYAAAVGSTPLTKASVLSAMVTSVNRINGVYEKELSIHMNLVAKEDTLIFLTSDSYSNANGSAMLTQNQTVCDARIGSANYDIGHVFSTGGGGIAGLGVVCVGGQKANGVTGSTNPVGDSYDIDYVAHEMGHQFGGNHTFNSKTSSCNGNGERTASYEPGSGTTIMAYAGICGTDDTQLHSDDYFHRKSIDEIYTYISSTSCAVLTAATNSAPTVTDYTSTYYIPYKTSFEVTASATSAHSNPISYCWEEYDLGPFGAWNVANNTTAPIFRSFNPNASPTRVFPIWDSLVRNSIKYKGEVLPEVARDVKLRCTVRDIENGYGVFNAPDVNLTAKAIVTPTLFRVTSQPTASTITGNTTQTVTWDVANTTASPISCANVDIYLSLDSARTFLYFLASSVPNNGTASVLIPDVSTATFSARLKVKGNGNIFFDLNDAWIKINRGASSVASSFSSADTTVCQGSSLILTNTSTGTPDSVRWTIAGGTPSTSTSTTTVSPVFNTVGPYTVTLVAYKSGIGSTPASRLITVKARPLTSVNSPTICSGQTATLTAAGASSYSWTGGLTGSPSATTPILTTITSYVVTGTSNGCSSTATATVSINSVPSTPAITQSRDTLYSSVIVVGASYEWYKSGLLVSTTATPYYKIASSGDYTVKVISNSCSSTLSTSFAAVLTGIRNNTLAAVFNVLPNPNNGQFDVQLTVLKGGKYQLMIYNAVGQSIVKEEVLLQSNVMNTKKYSINGMEKGMYIIALSGTDGVATQHFIVQ